MLRSASRPGVPGPAEHARLRALLAADGPHDSLGYFVLHPDKSVVFSPDQAAAIGYRELGGVSLAAADPVGPPRAWPGAIDAWLVQAHRHGRVPAVLGASRRGAAAYHRMGLHVLGIGDEAVVDVADFTLTGRSMRGVRQAVARTRRLGCAVDVATTASLSHAERVEVQDAAARWRHGTAERGFAMALGRLADPADPDTVVVRCRDRDRALIGLLSFVPWGPGGLSLDLMRRDPAGPNGAVELMVTELLTGGDLPGVTRVSLNFAVLRSVFERGAQPREGLGVRGLRSVLLATPRRWQLESLYRSSLKYHPAWYPRYLCYGGRHRLPQVMLAVTRAEGFLPVIPERTTPASAHRASYG